jgi:hypothetical protein
LRAEELWSKLVDSVDSVGRDGDGDGDGNDVELQFDGLAIAEVIANVGTMK